MRLVVKYIGVLGASELDLRVRLLRFANVHRDCGTQWPQAVLLADRWHCSHRIHHTGVVVLRLVGSRVSRMWRAAGRALP